jgi:hypothetical protein
MSTTNSDDNDLEADGIPDLFEAPPGQDVETDSEGMMAPGDEPNASVDYGTTSREERTDEPLAQRVRREEPEVGLGDLGAGDEAPEAPRLVAEDIDVNMPDLEDDAVAAETDDGGALSAEEAAMHITSGDAADDIPVEQERREYTGDR